MIYSDFAAMVIDFVNRQDLTPAKLLPIVNMAKSDLQLELDLTFVLKKIALTYPTAEGVGIDLPSDFKSFPYKYSVTLGDPTTGKVTPVTGTTLAAWLRRQAAHGTNEDINKPLSSVSGTQYYIVFIAGAAAPTMFLAPELPSAPVTIWYNSTLPDYANDSDEDVLLTIGRSALFFFVMETINSFVKDEEKIPINEAAKQDAIARVRQYCSTVLRSGANIDRD